MISLRASIATVMGSLLLPAPLALAGVGKRATMPAKTEANVLPEVRVPKVMQAVSLDGKGGDPVWSRAATVGLTDFWSKPNASKTQATRIQATQVSLLHDGEKLYIAFDCEDADIQATRKEHDGQTFRDDCVEIFLGAPISRIADSACLEINALGTLADYYYRHADWINYRFESKAEIKVSHSPNDKGEHEQAGYRIEVAIAFSTIRALLSQFPEEGAASVVEGEQRILKLRANFARWDRGQREAGGERFSIWSNPLFSFPHPHNPDRYGWLLLEE